MVLLKSDGTEPDENKMHVDGDETKTPEKTVPFKSKVRDHASRASFKTSPTWSNVEVALLSELEFKHQVTTARGEGGRRGRGA